MAWVGRLDGCSGAVKFAIIIFLFAPSLFCQSLLEQDEKDLLRYIDDLCGDTWCESDSDYIFKTLQCDFKAQRCVMTFDILPWGMIRDKASCQRIEKQCVIEGLRGSDDLLTRKKPTGIEINREFYYRLGECVNKVSEQVYASSGTNRSN